MKKAPTPLWIGGQSQLTLYIHSCSGGGGMGSLSNSPKPFMRKVRTSRRHLLAEKELSMVHGTLNIFFRNKTFLLVKIEI